MTAALCAVFFSGSVWAENDDFVYWPQFTILVHDGKHVDVNVFTDSRFNNNAGNVDPQLVSLQAKYDFIGHISFGTNYTYIWDKKFSSSAGKSEYFYQHRLEVEVNPYYKISDWLKVDNRNRVEFRWIEDNGADNARSRRRLRFTFPLVKDLLPRQEGLYMDSEFFL